MEVSPQNIRHLNKILVRLLSQNFKFENDDHFIKLMEEILFVQDLDSYPEYVKEYMPQALAIMEEELLAESFEEIRKA